MRGIMKPPFAHLDGLSSVISWIPAQAERCFAIGTPLLDFILARLPPERADPDIVVERAFQRLVNQIQRARAGLQPAKAAARESRGLPPVQGGQVQLGSIYIGKRIQKTVNEGAAGIPEAGGAKDRNHEIEAFIDAMNAQRLPEVRTVIGQPEFAGIVIKAQAEGGIDEEALAGDQGAFPITLYQVIG